MEQEKQIKTEKVAAEIIQMSKNKLLVNMRFMDMALNQFRMSPRPDLTPFSACDGDVYVYDPVHILKAYMLDENLPIRNFLHSVLHCVFKHFYVNTLVDQTMWDLACDIAVESAINDLELSKSSFSISLKIKSKPFRQKKSTDIFWMKSFPIIWWKSCLCCSKETTMSCGISRRHKRKR